MRFADPALQIALDAWRRNPVDRERAMADNGWFEERIGPVRLAFFEREAAGAVDADALFKRHVAYVRDYIEIEDAVPHTFMSDFEPAVLSP